MTTAQIRERIEELGDACEGELLTADGFDDAIIGVVSQWSESGQSEVVCYDYALCVLVLIKQGMDMDEAHEYMSFNVLGAYVGEGTPVFLYNLRYG